MVRTFMILSLPLICCSLEAVDCKAASSGDACQYVGGSSFKSEIGGAGVDWPETSAKFLFYFLVVVVLQKLRQTWQGCSDTTTFQQTQCKKLPADEATMKHTALVQAVMSGDLDRCKNMTSDGYSLVSVDAWGCTALHVASQNGALHIVQWLLSQEVPVDAADSCDETPLHLAARNGHVEVCESLIAHGASVHTVNSMDQNCLLVAAMAGKEQACRLIRSRGAVVEQVDSVPIQFQACLVETGCECTK